MEDFSQKDKYFCILPWTTLMGKPDGNIGVCYMNRSIEESHIFWSIQKSKISELWNCENIKNLRKTMMESRPSTFCNKCYIEEEKWLESLRIRSLRGINNDVINQYKKKTDRTWYYSGNIQELSLLISNLCNLSCRMCGSYASSKRRELDKLLWEEIIKEKKDIYDCNNFWDDVSTFQQIERLYISGGEPFYDRMFYRILHFLILNKRSKHISLRTFTNLTIFHHEEINNLWYASIKDIFLHFKKVYVWASIDALWKTLEYIRIGAVWDDIEQNLQKFLFLSQNIENITFEVKPLVMKENIYDILKLYIYCKKINIPIELRPILHPEYYCIKNIHEIEKIKIKKLYQKCIDRYETSIPNIQRDLEVILDFMFSDTANEKKIKQYEEVTRVIDIFHKIDR